MLLYLYLIRGPLKFFISVSVFCGRILQGPLNLDILMAHYVKGFFFSIYVRCGVHYVKFIHITWQYVIFRLHCSIHLSVSSNKVSKGIRRPEREVDYSVSSSWLRILFKFRKIFLFSPRIFPWRGVWPSAPTTRTSWGGMINWVWWPRYGRDCLARWAVSVGISFAVVVCRGPHGFLFQNILWIFHSGQGGSSCLEFNYACGYAHKSCLTV